MATWQGFFSPPFTGFYDLTITSSDGSLVNISGFPIHDQWHLMNVSSFTYTDVYFDATENYLLEIEYFNTEGSAEFVFSWASPSLGIALTPIPAAYFFHTESCDCSQTGYVGDLCTISELPTFLPFYYFLFYCPSLRYQ